MITIIIVEVGSRTVENKSSKPIGGVARCTVEVDEAKFTNVSTKEGDGGRAVGFGGICRETQKVFLVPVESRDGATLVRIIEECCAENLIYIIRKERKEMFYLTTYSTHFILRLYGVGYIIRKETKEMC